VTAFKSRQSCVVLVIRDSPHRSSQRAENHAMTDDRRSSGSCSFASRPLLLPAFPLACGFFDFLGDEISNSRKSEDEGGLTMRMKKKATGFFVLLLASWLLFVIQDVVAKEENLYKILGVKKTATTKEIKTAYRRKALDTHPDKRKDIPPEQAAEEFHKVVHAFEILSDENSRKFYDRTGRAQQQTGGGGGGGGSGFQGWSSQSFHFQWSRGGQYRRRRLRDNFKVQEAMSRVMHIVSMTQLETVMLDENERLERNLLMVFVTPQEVEQHVDEEICFPYPFAAMSEQGYVILGSLLLSLLARKFDYSYNFICFFLCFLQS
jgi:curved DNA-binding protein CbpA